MWLLQYNFLPFLIMKRAMKPIHPGAILLEDVLNPYNLTITDATRDLQISLSS